jgi:hypothetical protein
MQPVYRAKLVPVPASRHPVWSTTLPEPYDWPHVVPDGRVLTHTYVVRCGSPRCAAEFGRLIFTNSPASPYQLHLAGRFVERQEEPGVWWLDRQIARDSAGRPHHWRVLTRTQARTLTVQRRRSPDGTEQVRVLPRGQEAAWQGVTPWVDAAGYGMVPRVVEESELPIVVVCDRCKAGTPTAHRCRIEVPRYDPSIS